MTRKKKLMRTDMRTYLDVFRLCFEDQLSHRQIALVLGIGRSTVTDLISRFNNLNLAWPLAPSVSLNNAKYVISTTVPDTVSGGVRHMCAINPAIILFLQNMDKWMSQNGVVDVTLPDADRSTAINPGIAGSYGGETD
ncbi:hypothetical protein [Xenorhabdus bovienii]|uniref:hypothetical protein n=1 Tax=Xenorhabdus bovienii TaxID=40576 RepID=UPI0023B20D7B|nr:hypothetical protein [Xenorhabdus bovienii]MDE9454602.1 hypothetical protein [Xenorhabdus bovienii]MDE9568865.1 hypothetical protein [Xenorhabdus bovienii]